MKKTVFTALFAGVALTGCFKERYEDPQKFMDGPAKSVIMEYMKEDMQRLSIKEFEFRDARVEMEQWNGECVTAAFSLIPEKGTEYFHVEQLEWPEKDISFEFYVFPDEYRDIVRQISWRGRTIVSKDDLPKFKGDKLTKEEIKELLEPDFRVKVMRQQDGEGVYRVRGGGGDVKWGQCHWSPGEGCGMIVTSAEAKKSNLMDMNSEKARCAVVEFIQNSIDLKYNLDNLRKAFEKYQAVVRREGWGFNEGEYSWILQELRSRCANDPQIQALYKEATKQEDIPYTGDWKKMQEQKKQANALREKAKGEYNSAVAKVREKVRSEHPAAIAAAKKDIEKCLDLVKHGMGIADADQTESKVQK